MAVNMRGAITGGVTSAFIRQLCRPGSRLNWSVNNYSVQNSPVRRIPVTPAQAGVYRRRRGLKGQDSG